MKIKAKQELKSKSIPELEKEITKRAADLFQLRLDISMGKIKNTSSAKRASDELATLKTILKEKKLIGGKN